MTFRPISKITLLATVYCAGLCACTETLPPITADYPGSLAQAHSHVVSACEQNGFRLIDEKTSERHVVCEKDSHIMSDQIQKVADIYLSEPRNGLVHISGDGIEHQRNYLSAADDPFPLQYDTDTRKLMLDMK